MRAHRWTATLALAAAAAASPSGAPASAHTAAPEPTVPFGVRDLVRLARISQAAVSPDGKHVAYTLRTTDMDANSGRTAIWTIETRKRNASPARITDLEANSSSPEWAGDFLYYLSNRSGSMQVWRIAPGGDPKQVTALPLDVGSFHVSPKSDRVFVTRRRIQRLRDSRVQQGASRHRGAPPGARSSCTTRFSSGTGTRGATAAARNCSRSPLDASGVANGTPVNLTSGLDGDVPGKPFGGGEDYAISPDGQQVAFSVRAVPVGEPWSTNFDVYIVAAGGGTAAQSHRRQPRLGRAARVLSGRLAARLSSRWSGPDSNPTGFIWCFSICRAAPSVRSPRTGIDRSAASPGRVTARRCSRPPIIWASIPCGRSMSRPAGLRRSPATARSRDSASAPRSVLHPEQARRVPPISIRSDSTAASPRSSPI